MANFTAAPDDDDYDVFITDDLNNNDTKQCHPKDANFLLVQLVPPFYTTVFLVGLLVNFVAVLLLVKYKGLHLVENIYLLNLVVSNLCFLSSLPFWAYAASHEGTLGHPMCSILVTLSSVGLHGEAFFNTLLTLQSLFSAAQKVLHGIVVSVLAWVTAILATLPELLSHRPQADTQNHKCLLSRPHFLPGRDTSWEHFLTWKVSTAVLLVPSLTFIVCFGCFMRMRRTLRSGDKRKYDFIKLVFAIMVVFLLMWGPYNIALFLATFKKSPPKECGSSYNLDRSVQVARAIASTYCCISPLLYVLLNKVFWAHLCQPCRLCGDTLLGPATGPAHDAPREGQDLCTHL